MIKAIHLARIEGPTQNIFRELIVCKFSNLLKLQWTIVHIFMYMFSVSHDYPVHCMFSVYLSIIAAVGQAANIISHLVFAGFAHVPG